MFHELLALWFHWVEAWGYWGVFILMALESSIVPVPSEIVMPPAAYWAAQGRMSFAGVVFMGTAGSFLGSIVNYYFAQWIGGPFLKRYGKWVLLPPQKLELAEQWVLRYGTTGIFFARLLPVVRHLISIPAGALKLPVIPFSVATLLGAGLWCWILSWFGVQIIGDQPDLLQSPESLSRVIKEKLLWFVAAVVLLGLAVIFVTLTKRKWAKSTQ